MKLSNGLCLEIVLDAGRISLSQSTRVGPLYFAGLALSGWRTVDSP